MPLDFKNYDTEDFYDEMIDSNGAPHPGARILAERIESLPDGDILARQKAAEVAMYNMGITFTVYGSEEGTEKIFPFDIIPRIVEAHDWEFIERGLKQRIHALNLFLDDIYHEQKILKDKAIPEEIILSATSFRPQCVGLDVPRGIWCHITGTDLVRDRDPAV